MLFCQFPMTYSAFDPSFTGWVVARTAVSRVDTGVLWRELSFLESTDSDAWMKLMCGSRCLVLLSGSAQMLQIYGFVSHV